MSTTTGVKVGVRIRPLQPKEQNQNIILQPIDDRCLNLKGQQFTYDFVFGMELSQDEFYSNTAAPMLKSFLEGYNVTIMAYGQTGSGKTFTMGTSDTQLGGSSNQGLIPRFVVDLFENIQTSCGENETVESKVKVSFLEIYGEDVFDLIGLTSKSSPSDRPSLPVREDESGRVFVQGQYEAEVNSAQSVLDLLSSGSRNRITGSTAMNAGSSRSHAVFTISIEQCVQTSSSTDDVHRMVSKLTFVDLAGSERLKRTGAEGQRLKEGIQINSGLFNLGQVINALADETKLKQGARSGFVPYRNSKLTHLLKDALGGNSQTLFLACVSPAESNENETLSTLNYAKQARNIQNKPVKNMDKTQLEIRKLKYAVKTWMTKAVALKFASLLSNSSSLSSSPSSLLSVSTFTSPPPPLSLPPPPPPPPLTPTSSFKSPTKSHSLLHSPPPQMNTSTSSALILHPMNSEGMTLTSPMPAISPIRPLKASDLSLSTGGVGGGGGGGWLLQREEVQLYIQRVNQAIELSLLQSQGNMSPRKVRLSFGGPNKQAVRSLDQSFKSSGSSKPLPGKSVSSTGNTSSASTASSAIASDEGATVSGKYKRKKIFSNSKEKIMRGEKESAPAGRSLEGRRGITDLEGQEGEVERNEEGGGAGGGGEGDERHREVDEEELCDEGDRFDSDSLLFSRGGGDNHGRFSNYQGIGIGLGLGLGSGLGSRVDHTNPKRESFLASKRESFLELQSHFQDPDETEKLVSRMIEMIHKEKELYVEKKEKDELTDDEEPLLTEGQQEGGGGDPAAMIDVDRMIDEKEEILKKLRETVRGYAVMKTEYEKLLDSIGALEEERNELENSLERVKKENEMRLLKGVDGGEAIANHTNEAVDVMNARFSKVKEELKLMKDQCRMKEGAYKLMQREAKQCELLNKEIQKLKESKVSMLRQQKAQAQQMNKLKKDHSSAVSLLKKSDVKKQQALNALRSELVKKQRIIGHKEREISRINSKLKACEEHISQLLKIQNRNRKLNTTSSSVASSASSSLNSSAFSSSGSNNNSSLTKSSELTGRGGLTPSENEHLVTSKAILDNLVLDRVDLRTNKLKALRRQQAYLELAKEMRQESIVLDTLKEKKKSLFNQLKGKTLHPISFEDLDVNNNNNFNLQFLDDVCPPEEQQALQGEVLEVLTQLSSVESNLMQIASECEDCQLEYEEIMKKYRSSSPSLPPLSSLTSTSCPSPLDDPALPSLSAWEEIGKEIVIGFSMPQLQHMVWELLAEKAELVERVQSHQGDLASARELIESANCKIQELDNVVMQSRKEMVIALANAERQRVKELWAVLGGRDGSDSDTHKTDFNSDPSNAESALTSTSSSSFSFSSSSSSSSSSSFSTSTKNEGRSLSEQIAIQRAQDLERELESLVNSEEVLRAKILTLTSSIEMLEKKNQDLELRATAFDLPSSSSTTSLPSFNSSPPGESKYSPSCSPSSDTSLETLLSIWDSLGLSQSERLDAMELLKSQQLHLQSQVIQQEKDRLERETLHFRRLKESLSLLSRISGDEPEEEDPLICEDSQPQTKPSSPIPQQSLLLRDQLFASFDSLKPKLKQASDLLMKFLSLEDQLRLQPCALSAQMQLLKNIECILLNKDVKYVIETDTQAQDIEPLIACINQFQSLTFSFGLFSEENLNVWDNEIKKISLQKMLNQQKINDLRLQLISLAQQISLLTLEDLRAIGNNISSLEGVSSVSMLEAVDLVFRSLSPSPTPSLEDNNKSTSSLSDQLIEALNALKFMFESVRASRTTVHTHLVNFIKFLNIHLMETSYQYPLVESDSSSPSPSTFDRNEINRMFQFINCIQSLTTNAISKLQYKILSLYREAHGTAAPPEELFTLKIQEILQSKKRPPGEFEELIQILDELSEFVLFSEENEITELIQKMKQVWGGKASSSSSPSEPTGLNLLWQLSVLRSEVNRLSIITEAMREVMKLDAQLTKHVSEMEEFELNSKQDRIKVLSGSSKALIEEEKFRKAGKRKFEHLSEKILAAMSTLHRAALGLCRSVEGSELPPKSPTASSEQRTSGTKGPNKHHHHSHHSHPINNNNNNNNNSSSSSSSNSSASLPLSPPSLELSVDHFLASLSPQTQNLCRGNIRLRETQLELMHLHTSTQGIKRTSFEKNSESSSSSSISSSSCAGVVGDENKDSNNLILTLPVNEPSIVAPFNPLLGPVASGTSPKTSSQSLKTNNPQKEKEREKETSLPMPVSRIRSSSNI